MGSLGGLIKLLPGMNKIDEKTLKSGEMQLRKIQAMIDSMSNEERKEPKLLLKSPKRRKRIAAGSGYTDADVDKMISDFERMKNMMQGIVRGDFSKLGGNPMMQGSSVSPDSFGGSRINRSEKGPKNKDIRKKKGFFDL
jgi:signal recognition particle subunit SRP54